MTETSSPDAGNEHATTTEPDEAPSAVSPSDLRGGTASPADGIAFAPATDLVPLVDTSPAVPGTSGASEPALADLPLVAV